MKTPFLLSLALVGLLPSVTHAQVQSTVTPNDHTGIEGTITMSPVQGGPTRQGSLDSKPLANMAFEVRQGDRVITSFRTDEQGHFRQLLEPSLHRLAEGLEKCHWLLRAF